MDVFNTGILQLQIHKKLCHIKFNVPLMRRLSLSKERPSEYSNADSILLITLHVRTVTGHPQGHLVILEDVSKVKDGT